MSDFKVKMHQIVCRLGLRPRPRWGSLQCSPYPLAGFYVSTFKGKREGREGKGREGEGGEGKGGKERKKGKGKEGERGWGGEEAGSAPQAKAWPHQNYFPVAGAGFLPTRMIGEERPLLSEILG